MKWSKLTALAAAALILAVVVARAGSFLVINQPPRKADVIIVLSGGKGARLARGIQLYRRGYAPYLLFTSSATDREKRQAVAAGVPARAFLLDRKAQNTYQNAVYAKALMERYDLRSAIVVSSDYHMRRASLIFGRVFRGTSVVFTYVSVKDPDFHPGRWWTSRQTILRMCWEYGGIVVFYLGLGPYITDAWVYHSPFKYIFRYMH